MTPGMTQAADAALRAHLRALLTAPQAHLTLEGVLEDFPLERLHERPGGLPYSAWDLLWHLRFAQRDILNFVRDGTYAEPQWPAAYWPQRTEQPSTEQVSAEVSAEDWHAQAQACRDDLAALLELLDDPATDLLAVVPNGAGPEGGGQTWLREFLLVADHNAYHVGQLMVLRRLLESTETN
ncbi:DinB family protein [Deinococcus budaensis]|uniref:Putative damage-inducible protein DinB n=1 Tax=Deinococcus budaensis TaxID=1665626 RepID=A0A7W8GHM5_9DEIO|nr:DinB family protein [Deinococcus budaensis]MBB5235321.1 putative damage-inducible protein DinB [Deinococcus budaensis]